MLSPGKPPCTEPRDHRSDDITTRLHYAQGTKSTAAQVIRKQLGHHCGFGGFGQPDAGAGGAEGHHKKPHTVPTGSEEPVPDHVHRGSGGEDDARSGAVIPSAGD
jgi:hypothetical protein